MKKNKFKIGDKVKVRPWHWFKELIGKTGKVIIINYDFRLPFGVNFGKEYKSYDLMGNTHNLGELKKCTGFWFAKNEISKVRKK